ncbi:MAG: proline--tRNA ligase [Anaerolineae bacterium]|nr:proline--tRNA ligase [Anaerolineae bacterium]
MSNLFSQTLRQAPAEADVTSYQLLVRAGFIRQLSSGIFSYLTLGVRAMRKIESIIREEMDAIGGQEITMPVVQPAEIWKETGRWYQVGPEMARFKDRADRDMVLGMTHEEVVADLVRREISSYRQLPRLVYQIQTKFRDEPRSRAGLIRVREFTMKDSYSLDVNWDGLDVQYRRHYQAYYNIYHRCGLPVLAVGSDTGMMGGSLAHEFMYLAPIGEDTLFVCDNCDYAANREVARFRKPLGDDEDALPLEKVATPGTTTIESLADYLKIPKSKTAKAFFQVATMPQDDGYADRFVLAIIRGDMDINETKLANALKAKALRPATEDEIAASGAVPGYGSAIGAADVLVIVDDSVESSPNLVAGANESGYHFINSNYGRDYTAAIVADIAAARDGDACPHCGEPLRSVRGVEVGNIFKLGTRYSAALGATFLDENGTAQPVIMGSYGIGVGRLLACVAEEHNDAQGLIWPVTIAPFQVHLVLAGGDNPAVRAAAERLYVDLSREGVEVLYDDREERPGVKFNDADLIGLPLRIVAGARALAEGGVEIKRRGAQAGAIVPVDAAVTFVQAELRALRAEIDATVVDVPFRE